MTVYEQDWLGAQAQTEFNLVDSEAFLGNMAAAMASQGTNVPTARAINKGRPGPLMINCARIPILSLLTHVLAQTNLMLCVKALETSQE